MVKFHEADARKFRSVFVCMRCKAKIRGPNAKVLKGMVKCRRCESKVFRAVKKK